MISREDLYTAIKGIVEPTGLSLFDIDYPTLATPTLRVYVWRAPAALDSSKEESTNQADGIKERRGVTLDECAHASRAISAWLELGGAEGSDTWLLEVSSPGINRRLRLKEHFESALGERVRLKLRREIEEVQSSDSSSDSGKRESIVGQILEVGESTLVLLHKDESLSKGRKGKRSPSAGADKKMIVPLGIIEEARVDFNF